MTRCTLALAALLLILASTTTAFVRPPLSPPPLALLHATEPTRDVFTASLFEDKASDPLRQDGYWEELFMKGSSGAVPSEASRVSLLKESTTPPPEGEGVEVVSFDLDDTLWCGKTVINNANKYVWGWMGACGGHAGDGRPTSCYSLSDANSFHPTRKLKRCAHLFCHIHYQSSNTRPILPPSHNSPKKVPCKLSSKPTTPPWWPRANPPFQHSCGSWPGNTQRNF